jgi:hypothetical protein
VTADDREDVVRKVGVIALWFGLGLAATELAARAIERFLLTAPTFLMAERGASPSITARTDLPANAPRRP